MSRMKEQNERLSFGTLIGLFSPSERILFATNCQIQLRTNERSRQQTHDSTTQPSSDCIDVPADGVTNCRRRGEKSGIVEIGVENGESISRSRE